VPYRVDGGVGRYEFTSHRVGGPEGRFNAAVDLFARLKAKGVYRTRWFRRNGLFAGCTDLSYRKTLEQLNRTRQQPGGTVLRTLCNAAEHEAAAVVRHLDRRADELLLQPRFDAHGRPLFQLDPEVPEPSIQPLEAVHDAIRECLPENARADILPEELAANPFPYEGGGSVTAISIDDVGVKKQKLSRKPGGGGSTGKKKAWTTVAHVQRDGTAYTLTAPSVPAVLRLVSALLAASGLEQSDLLFFTDGQRSLKDAIFAFWEARGRIRLILDWYHLQRKCRELCSLGLRGSIARKKVHIEELHRLLWHGLVDRALAYIDALPANTVRQPEVVEQIKGYLERNRFHIPCYAVRSRLGLRCSSNLVEKQNDIVVARRQKNNGMGWSEDGSHALSTLATVRRNGEMDTWLSEGVLAFRLPFPMAA
jgi:hypothetical protein